MDFWKEYEGKLLAEPYPLEKLVRSEGASGLFLTSNGSGNPAMVRVSRTSDEDAELLAQWHAVAALNEPHIVALTSFGQTILGGEALTFAVMERPDATLAETLRGRPMTAEETRHIAASLVPALKALHGRGLAHGRIEAAGVFAIGDAIKLRSDCARRVAGRDDAAKLKERDVRDFATLLLESLTQKRIRAGKLSRLPSPFAEIISHGLKGDWSLDDISRALESATPSAPAGVGNDGAGVSAGPDAEAGKAGEPMPSASAKASPAAAISVRDRNFLVATAAATILIVLWLCIHLATGNIPEAASRSARGPGAAANAAAATASSASAPRAAPAAPKPPSWRVVAYSFRREGAAKEKAGALLRKYPWVDAEVVDGSGRSPYLVTLGGRMTREEAMAFERRLQGERFRHAVRLEEIGAR